jgi:Na+/H+-dicarboxylate symporter
MHIQNLMTGVVFIGVAALAIFGGFPTLAFSSQLLFTVFLGAVLSGLFIYLWPQLNLPTRILLGLILGALAGVIWGPQIQVIKPIGTAFIRLIKMIVIPLIFASLIVGAASLGDIKKVGRIGIKTMSYFLISTCVAITLGLTLANLIQPGKSLPVEIREDLLSDYESSASEQVGGALTQSYQEILLDIIPENPIQSMTRGNMLQVIFFALFMGIVMSMLPEDRMRPVRSFFEGINDIMAKIVHVIIQIAPFGVFALIASVVGSFGVHVLMALLNYAMVVILGQLILFLLYPLVVSLTTSVSYGQFLSSMRPAQLIAFSSSSSSATLPVTIQSVEEGIGVKRQIASFVLPLGATINMDGTALFQGVSAVFIAQVYNMDLSLSAQLSVVLTAVLASIGTAGAPGVGVLMLVIVLKQIGIPLEGIALILGVERILDMFRTTVNVTSDAAATVLIAKSEGQLQPSGSQ